MWAFKIIRLLLNVFSFLSILPNRNDTITSSHYDIHITQEVHTVYRVAVSVIIWVP